MSHLPEESKSPPTSGERESRLHPPVGGLAHLCCWEARRALSSQRAGWELPPAIFWHGRYTPGLLVINRSRGCLWMESFAPSYPNLLWHSDFQPEDLTLERDYIFLQTCWQFWSPWKTPGLVSRLTRDTFCGLNLFTSGKTWLPVSKGEQV